MLSQHNNDSQRSKTTKKARSAKNEQNQHIYDKFDILRKSAMMKNNKNMMNCYAKILRSLEKYPMPILSGIYSSMFFLNFLSTTSHST